MVKVYIGLASNYKAKFYLATTIKTLQHYFSNIKVSTIYKSISIDGDGSVYFNCVVEIQTFLSIRKLKALLKKIEFLYGRDPIKKNCNIDLDILLYGNNFDESAAVLSSLPHKDILDRAYVLKPLSELAPNFIFPVLNKSILQIWYEKRSQLENLITKVDF